MTTDKTRSNPLIGHRLWAFRARAPLAALLAAAFLAGCAGGGRRAREAPEIPGYLTPGRPLEHLDTSPLRGRTIVLDPGHGGRFRGALGPAGLSEADVNLGVALHLRELLVNAGADVHLTRSADTDLSTPTDSTLAGDLDRRVALVEALRPDAFVSLHHNSNAALDRALNETQTYYRAGDDGASLDLARAIHRQLALRLGIRPARLLPGNFRVLRQDAAPSVLGEPAMISHPVIEYRLRQPGAQRLEAEAYFLGLLDYFRGGRPAWLPAQGDTVWYDAGYRPVAAWSLRTGDADSTTATGPDADLLSFAVTLDRQPQPFDLDPDGLTVRWRATAAFGAGRHRLEIEGGNLAGRRAPRRGTWLLPAPARRANLVISVDVNGRAALAWTAPDGHPLPAGAWIWPDGTRVACGTAPRGWTLLDAVPTGSPAYVPATAEEPALETEVTRDDLAAPWCWHVLDGAPPGPARWRLPAIRPPVPAAFLDGAPLTVTRNDLPLWCEWPGLLPLIDPAPGRADTARTVDGRSGRWTTTALAPGLAGLVVVLDPAGGSDDPDGTGPLGLRGSDVNLAAAREAAALLRGAGATVHLTRHGETALNPPAKVALAEDVAADLFVTIGRAAATGPLEVRHHAGSVRGAVLAEALARACAALPTGDHAVAVTEGWEYLLRQTRCPAVALGLPAIGDEDREVVLGDAAWAAAEARAVLLGVAAAALTERRPLDRDPWPAFDPGAALAIIAGQPGSPVAGDVTAVIVDGQFPWRPCPPLPDPAGATATPSLTSVSGPGLPPGDGRHVLEIRTAGAWQLWLIEPGRDGVVVRRMAGGTRGGKAADDTTAGTDG